MTRHRFRARVARAIEGFLRPDQPDDILTTESVIRLVPERGIPIGSLLLLFYPRRATAVSISEEPAGETLSARHQQVIVLDPRLPLGWTGADVASYLEQLASGYRADELLTANEMEEASK